MGRFYQLRSPRSVVRIEPPNPEIVLPVPAAVDRWAPQHGWGVTGGEANVTAATLLLDAAGDILPRDLLIASQALVNDLLVGIAKNREGFVGLDELRAWVEDGRATMPGTPPLATIDDAHKAAVAALNDPNRDWFLKYRERHGTPWS